MAVKFQYNKTSLQRQKKDLHLRERILPTIKSKESALRLEVRRVKKEVEDLEAQVEHSIENFDTMTALWSEFDPSLVRVEDVHLETRKVAGIPVPVLGEVDFEVRPFSLLNTPSWYMEGTQLIKNLATVGIQAEVGRLELDILQHARRKTTQKVNLFEKVQIPGLKEAILKIKRYLEDEESLSKASQKIMRAHLDEEKEKRRNAMEAESEMEAIV
ncbi:V-type ATP synthase subunit D [Porphyromonas sp. HMSC065F10]|uniref:V-type ATP synthase subunit D n=1 Tax=Porphyromonas sp. HMSC065F10 TaxID=1739394 RepID=UPI0008A5AB19|nr:V-type ATP synthase subunit D [Porphyromonas sp. HMSC065F10]OFR39588.1 ATP synthase subunit D [Porphyromonas sp. HMSC065F10]